MSLSRFEKLLNKKLKKQAQNGLAQVFDELSCKGVANEIRKGRNVTGNTEFGIKVCVHSKIGPRVNPKTLKITPTTERGKQLEKSFIEKANYLLESGGFQKMSPDLYSQLRKKDSDFEKYIAKRRKKKKS